MKHLYKISLLLILIASSMIACEQEEGDSLSLDDIQAPVIAEENKYQLKFTLDIFDYQVSSLTLGTEKEVQTISANANGEFLKLFFPSISVGTYSGSLDRGTAITFFDRNGKFFSSNNERFASNVIIEITQIDTTQSTFSGKFSGRLYRTDGSNPADRTNQLNVIKGQLIRVPF